MPNSLHRVMMDEFWYIWRGQLFVGANDIGLATIWSCYNTLIPGLGGSLKMSCIGKYDDLWCKILRSEPCLLSQKYPTQIKDKTISTFHITSHTPQFLQLAQELTQTQKPCILTSELVNPRLLVEVILAPECAELRQLGLKPFPDPHQPSLNVIFVFNNCIENAMNIYNEWRNSELSAMKEFYTPSSGSEQINCSTTSKASYQPKTTEDMKKKCSIGYKSRRDSSSDTEIGNSKDTMKPKQMNTKLPEEKENIIEIDENECSINNKLKQKSLMTVDGSTKSKYVAATRIYPKKREKSKRLQLGETLQSTVAGRKKSDSSVSTALVPENTVTQAVTTNRKSIENEGNQYVGSRAFSMLDTVMLNNKFCSKSINKPDSIIPSMLKRSKRESSSKRMSNCKKIEKASNVDHVLSHLVKSDINKISKKVDGKNEQDLIKVEKDSCLPSSDKILKKLPSTKGNQEGKYKNVKSEKVVKIKSKSNNAEKKVPTNKSKMLVSKCSQVLAVGKQKPEVASPKLSKSLGNIEKGFNASENNEICIKIKSGFGKVDQLIADLGFKRKMNERVVDNILGPRKKIKVIVEDIMKGSVNLKVQDVQINTCSKITQLDANLMPARRNGNGMKDGIYNLSVKTAVIMNSSENINVTIIPNGQECSASGNQIYNEITDKEVTKPLNVDGLQTSCPRISQNGVESAHQEAPDSSETHTEIKRLHKVKDYQHNFISDNDPKPDSNENLTNGIMDTTQWLNIQLPIPLKSIQVPEVEKAVILDASKLSKVQSLTPMEDKSLPKSCQVRHPPKTKDISSNSSEFPSVLSTDKLHEKTNHSSLDVSEVLDYSFKHSDGAQNEENFKGGNFSVQPLRNSENSKIPSKPNMLKLNAAEVLSSKSQVNTPLSLLLCKLFIKRHLSSSSNLYIQENGDVSQICKSSVLVDNDGNCAVGLNQHENQKENIDQISFNVGHRVIMDEIQKTGNKGEYHSINNVPHICERKEVNTKDITTCIPLQYSALNEFGKSNSRNSSEIYIASKQNQSNLNFKSNVNVLKPTIEAYSMVLVSNGEQSPILDGLKTLSQFITKQMVKDQNVHCQDSGVKSNTCEGQQQRDILDQQLKALIVKQVRKLNGQLKNQNGKALPTSLNGVNFLSKYQNPRNLQLPGHYENAKNSLEHSKKSMTNTENVIIEKYTLSDHRLKLRLCPQRTSALAECDDAYTSDTQDSYNGMFVTKTSIFTPNNLYQPDWKDGSSPESSRELQMQKYIHLFNADQQDILKLKCLFVNHKKSYTALEEIEKCGGSIYIRPLVLDELLSHPSLRKLCNVPKVHFGVYNSLLAVLKGGATPILKSKWLLLVHHTAMLDESFDKLLEKVLKDRFLNSSHHHNVFVPILTLRTCTHILSTIQRRSNREQELGNILRRNIIALNKCVAAGAAQIIDGGNCFASLSPESPTSEFIMCVRVIHCCFGYGHRHTAVLVGNTIPESDATRQSFYNMSTVQDINKAIYVND
ncbi:uncharacterized protein [Procambarus clarkii]|uniref:uncharacterized protein isoform X2 n=1 Tax=Procambarus clarkii TaxID=6728 RepID=UPI001E677C1D|nr:uncharacterized protein LOC123772370 isoform X1 [Procambarus clarkii]